MSKVVLLGGSGYVGHAYRKFFEQEGVPYISLARSEIDYTDTSNLVRFLRDIKPCFLINAAGYTGKPNVDACEIDKANCLFGNAVLPGRIAEACATTGLPWGHVSSGCIYTGTRPDGNGFTEEDTPNFTFRQNNCSYYSGTKALGEEILTSYPNIYIWRLRIPFNQEDNARNYLSKLMRYDTLLDATNSISHLGEFVASTYAGWKKRIPYGIYNVTNPGVISTREIVQMIQASGLSNRSFRFFESEADFMTKVAKTPRSNCVLDTGKLQRAGIDMTPIRECIMHNLKIFGKACD